MQYFIIFFFTILFVNCKQELKQINPIKSPTYFKPNRLNNTNKQENKIIDSINLSLIREEISNEKEIDSLKKLFRSALERDFERPYMWDVFVDSNDILLRFYRYSERTFNDEKLKSIYIKIEYEDAEYEALMLVSNTDTEHYSSLVVYEELKSEEYYIRTSVINNNTINILLNKQIKTFISSYIYTNDLFLDYFIENKIDKKWKKNADDYKLKGNTKNHLKEGYWMEEKYSFDYNISVTEKGNYRRGVRVGKWNISPKGQVDKIVNYKNGKIVSIKYP